MVMLIHRFVSHPNLQGMTLDPWLCEDWKPFIEYLLRKRPEAVNYLSFNSPFANQWAITTERKTTKSNLKSWFDGKQIGNYLTQSIFCSYFSLFSSICETFFLGCFAPSIFWKVRWERAQMEWKIMNAVFGSFSTRWIYYHLLYYFSNVSYLAAKENTLSCFFSIAR